MIDNARYYEPYLPKFRKFVSQFPYDKKFSRKAEKHEKVSVIGPSGTGKITLQK